MNLEDAIDAGRFHRQWISDYISYEKNAVDSLTLSKLIMTGLKFRERSAIGSVNAIMILTYGKKSGVGDKRGNNSSHGY